MQKASRDMRIPRPLWFIVLLLSTSSWATTYSGYLNDPTNTALISSDVWSAGTPSSPQFTANLAMTADEVIANNVALYTFNLAAPGTVTFESTGYVAGGVNPYFTLFRGTGAGAVFVGSNYDTAGGGDFLISLSLAADDYAIALGAFFNMSYAENLGTGTLGDGFIGLGVPDLGNYFYELTADIGSGPSVPEPGTILLLGSALVAFAAGRKTGKR
jgi:hypothetical protein